MKLMDVTRQFQDRHNDCLDYIEKMRWPDGEIGCVHRGEMGRISSSEQSRLFVFGFVLDAIDS